MATYDWSKPLFITGTMTSAALAGGIASMSLLAIPALFRAPTEQLLLTEWRALRLKTRTYAQPLAILGASSYFLTAYITHHSALPERTYKLIAAGITTLSVIPFRFLGMYGANVELMSREEKSFDKDGQGDFHGAEYVAHGGIKGDTVSIIRWWGQMNLVRAALPFIGGLVAFAAL